MSDNELLLAISNMMDQKLNARLKPIEYNLQSVKDEVHLMKLFQENVIVPRLQNIESCYTDTYRRYQSGIEQLGAMQTDIDVMKSVISEHSNRLQKIS